MSETTKELRHPNLAAALAAFQEELPEIRKGNTAQVEGKDGKRGYSYDYADLSDIAPVVLKRLGAHGLAWTTSPTLLADGSGFVLTYQLLHESGEQLEGIYPLPPANIPPQQLGSAITYARRYALCAVTGVAPGGDDDDAAGAQAAAERQSGQPQQRRQQPIAPKKATRDWAKLAAETSSLEALTALAEEAEREGEIGLRVGEGLVIDVLKARKAQLEQEAAPPLDVDVPKEPRRGRQWVREARALTTWPEVRELYKEAKAAGAPPEALRQIEEFGESLPDPTTPKEAEPSGSWPAVREPGSGWAKPGDGNEPTDPPMALFDPPEGGDAA